MKEKLITLFSLVLLLSTLVLAQTQKPLINQDILRMLKAELSEETIIKVIDANDAAFDLSASKLSELRGAGASQKLIDAMLATERQRRKPQIAPDVVMRSPAVGKVTEGQENQIDKHRSTEKTERIGDRLEDVSVRTPSESIARAKTSEPPEVPQPTLTPPGLDDPVVAFPDHSGYGLGSRKGPGLGPGWDGGTGRDMFRIGGPVSAPQCAFCPDPKYSEEARRARHQGTVLLRVIVDEQGRAQDIRIVKKLGLGLDEEAVRGVRKWRFKPAERFGKPVAVYMNIEVNFRIPQGPSTPTRVVSTPSQIPTAKPSVHSDPDIAVIENFFNGIRGRSFELWLSSLSGYRQHLNSMKQQDPQVLWRKKSSEIRSTYKRVFESELARSKGSHALWNMRGAVLFFLPVGYQVLEKRPVQGTLTRGNTKVFVRLEFEKGRLLGQRGLVKALIAELLVEKGRVSCSPNAFLAVFTKPSLACFHRVVEGSSEYY